MAVVEGCGADGRPVVSDMIYCVNSSTCFRHLLALCMMYDRCVDGMVRSYREVATVSASNSRLETTDCTFLTRGGTQRRPISASVGRCAKLNFVDPYEAAEEKAKFEVAADQSTLSSSARLFWFSRACEGANQQSWNSHLTPRIRQGHDHIGRSHILIVAYLDFYHLTTGLSTNAPVRAFPSFNCCNRYTERRFIQALYGFGKEPAELRDM